jgi:tetraether lipid synthase
LQSTVISGINNDGVWSIVDFAIRNIDKVFCIVFQPIMFAGRDENVDDESRYRQRYTLSQLAEDLQAQSGANWQPLRDWFPTSVFGALGNLLDAVAAPGAKQGSVCCTHHPDTSVFSALVVNRRTKAWAPFSAFFNVEQFLRDIDLITSTAHGKAAAYTQMALSVLRNYRGQNAPAGFTVKDLLALFEQANVRSCTNSADWTQKVYDGKVWTALPIHGMWFQDLFNFDMGNVERSVTPVATSEGLIEFCAYNAGGWRQIVEWKHQTATLSEWHRRHGRHAIYAGGQVVTLPARPTSPQLPPVVLPSTLLHGRAALAKHETTVSS